MASLSLYHRYIVIWLFTTAAFVIAMAVIGAITRLTESGLSMVEWRPLIGAIPPLNDGEWQRVFDLYRETPEYQFKNFGMNITEFKTIFFWEWLHRLWGRLIGLVYAVGMLFAFIRYTLPTQLKWNLFGLLLLGAGQGVMGWIMVKSGLVDRPSVSHFRLAAHLSLAALITVLLVAQAVAIWRERCLSLTITVGKKTPILLWLSLISVSITLIWGAFVAGLDAGLIYNEFPKMGEGMVPTELSDPSLDLSLFERLIYLPTGVQFAHRCLAILSLIIVGITSIALLKNHCYKSSLTLFIGIIAQFMIGMITLIGGVQIIPATLHQLGAFLILVGITAPLVLSRS